jgi:hypothetical protein
VRIVGDTGPATERALRAGRLVCPACNGALRPWGTARLRLVHLGAGTQRAVQPRRARCSACGTTHVLLPDWMLLRRAYAAPVIWSALTSYAGGVGYRRIAVRLRLPETTVRDWLRAFRRVERGLLDQFARRGHVHDSAVTAVERLSPPHPAWRFAVLVTAGRLLVNTSPPRATAVLPSARPP